MSDDNIFSQLVSSVIKHGSADEAIRLMTMLRAEAMRLDKHLGDPRHEWNSVNG